MQSTKATHTPLRRAGYEPKMIIPPVWWVSCHLKINQITVAFISGILLTHCPFTPVLGRRCGLIFQMRKLSLRKAQ